MSTSNEPIELLDDETAITEMTFLPDGRCCLFGASKEILQLLHELNLMDTASTQRLTAIQAIDPSKTSIQTNASHE